MSEHLVAPAAVRELDAEARAGFERALAEELAGKGRMTYREPVEKAISAIDRRAELLGLVAAYRRLKRDLGLMDFSDQIALGARLAAEQPEVGELERARFRVVLLDEYQDTSVAQALMLGRLFSGRPDAAGTRSPPSATPTRRSTAGAARRCPTSSTSPRPSRPPTGDPSRRTRSPSTGAPTRRILEVANRLADAAVRGVRPGRAAGREAGRRHG